MHSDRPVALIGRATVSKTVCCWFESNQACNNFKANMIKKIRQFISEVTIELKKVSWLTKQELKDATWIVLVSSLCLGIFIACIDSMLATIVRIFIS